MNETDRPEEHEWERGWDGHTIAQRRRLGRLSLIEKLQWLEEAQRTMEHLRSFRQPRDPESPAGSG